MINWLFDNLVIVPMFVVAVSAAYKWGFEEGYKECVKDEKMGVKRYDIHV